jgi:hypothetical protein
MKRLAATVAALGAMVVVVTAEGAVPERPMAVRVPVAQSVEQLRAGELPVHTQEPVQGARCRGKKCTPEPVDVEAIGAPDPRQLPG